MCLSSKRIKLEMDESTVNILEVSVNTWPWRQHHVSFIFSKLTSRVSKLESWKSVVAVSWLFAVFMRILVSPSWGKAVQLFPDKPFNTFRKLLIQSSVNSLCIRHEKCLNPAFYVVASRGRVLWMQNEVPLSKVYEKMTLRWFNLWPQETLPCWVYGLSH